MTKSPKKPPPWIAYEPTPTPVTLIPMALEEQGAMLEEQNAMIQIASDQGNPAYWRGSDDGCLGAVRALTAILDGPLDARPCFGNPELQAMAERLLSMRAEITKEDT